METRSSSSRHQFGRIRCRPPPAPHSRETLEGPAECGLWGIALFAFALGFAHEEGIAILALCAGRASCWGVMAVNAVAVAGVILGLTLLSVAAFDRLHHRIQPWHDRLPRINAVVLVAMGILYAIDFLWDSLDTGCARVRLVRGRASRGPTDPAFRLEARG